MKRRLGYLLCLGAGVVTGLTLAACAGDDTDDEGGGNAGNDSMFGNPLAGTTGAGASGTSGASGANSSGNGAGASGVTSAPGVCAEGTVQASRVTPRVTLVLDGSCSMSTPYPANGAQSATSCDDVPNSRWSELRRALLDQNSGVVTRLAGLVEFGLVVYGTSPDCPLTAEPILPALDNFSAIDNAVTRVPPGMFTPTGAALDYVYNNLIEPPMLDTDQGTQVVVLATDGEPNSCGDAQTNYEPSLTASMLGQSLGARTYVISLADAQGEFHDHLQQLANLGGGFPANGGETAQLFEPANPDELAANLMQLIGEAIGCDIELNGVITDGTACQGSVVLNGAEIPCEDPNGWTMIDSRHIRLQGSACDAFKNDASAILRADFNCNIFSPD